MGVVVVAIILGVAVGASYQVPSDPDSYHRDFPEDWNYEGVLSYEYSERGELSEGESTQMEVDLNCEVVCKDDKFEIINKAFKLEPVNRIPYSVWKHFPEDDKEPGTLVKAQLAFQKKYHDI